VFIAALRWKKRFNDSSPAYNKAETLGSFCTGVNLALQANDTSEVILVQTICLNRRHDISSEMM